MDITERVKIRLPEERDENIISELITTISDRLCLRLGGVQTLPNIFFSVVVDATVKMHRRMYFEGITQEGTEGLSTSFVDDILNEYDSEITAYTDAQAKINQVVRFI